MTFEIQHLFERPQCLHEVARLIHEEWWSDKPGHSVSTMAARLELAKGRDSIPLSLSAGTLGGRNDKGWIHSRTGTRPEC